jgi:hypothetical protein
VWDVDVPHPSGIPLGPEDGTAQVTSTGPPERMAGHVDHDTPDREPQD